MLVFLSERIIAVVITLSTIGANAIDAAADSVVTADGELWRMLISNGVQISATGALAAVFFMIARGFLVPRSALKDAQANAERWMRLFEREQETRDATLAMLRSLIVAQNSQGKRLEEVQKVVQEKDAK